METEHLIQVENFCGWPNVEFSLITYLHENVLMEIDTHKENPFITKNNLRTVEKLLMLNKYLNIKLDE